MCHTRPMCANSAVEWDASNYDTKLFRKHLEMNSPSTWSFLRHRVLSSDFCLTCHNACHKEKGLICSNSFNVEENSLMMPWNRGTAQTPFCQQIWDGNCVCGQVLSLPLLLRLASWFLFCTSTMPAAAMRYWHVLQVEQGAHGDRTRRAFRRHSSQNTSIAGPQRPAHKRILDFQALDLGL
jgi:hypothetical protein